MTSRRVKIANAICDSFKKLPKKPENALLMLQIILVALYYYDSSSKCASFCLSDAFKTIGINFPNLGYRMEDLINSEIVKTAINVRMPYGVCPLIKGALCIKDTIQIYFDPDLQDLIEPSDDFTAFYIEDLFRFQSAPGLSLFLLNQSHHVKTKVLLADSLPYNWNLYDTCRILGLPKNMANNRHKKKIDELFQTALTDYKDADLEYVFSIKKSYRHQTISLDMTPIDSATTREHIEGTPIHGFFSEKISTILTGVSNNILLFKQDTLNRPISATVLLSKHSLSSLLNMKNRESNNTPGYGLLKRLVVSKKQQTIQKAHLIAVRFIGDGHSGNLVTASCELNKQMTLFENKVAKYLTTEDGIVLYRVEVRYKGTCPIPHSVRIGAVNIHAFDPALSLSIEIPNTFEGVYLDTIYNKEEKCYESRFVAESRGA